MATTTNRRTRKNLTTPEMAARIEARRVRLESTVEAIREGRAYLDTFVGRRKVTGYNDSTGWAVTGTGSNPRSFMICLEDIKVEAPEPTPGPEPTPVESPARTIEDAMRDEAAREDLRRRTTFERGYSLAELHAAFDLVKDRDDWKNRIDACVHPTFLPAVLVAVPFFTGGPARVVVSEDGRIRVSAPGYYASVGG